jgi:hypothetical protein
MPVIYSGSGASGFEIQGERYSRSEWTEIRDALRQLLARRKEDAAIKLLDRFDWTVVEATNDFADDFAALHARVPLPLYADNGHLSSTPAARVAARTLAETLTEITPTRSYIRHVAYDLDTSAGPQAVVAPSPQISSRTVQLALVDADRLLTAGSAVSAVDRVHTALMGYLRLLCERDSIEFAETDGASTLLKKLFKTDPATTISPHASHSLKVLRSAGAILDSFETIRNRGTVAHANDELLDEPEAALLVNIARSIFHYLDRRFED